MCARFHTPRVLEDLDFLKALPPERHVAMNSEIFPTHIAPIVLETGDERVIRPTFWSLYKRGPFDEAFQRKYSTFNARSETLTTSFLYRYPWKDRKRCLIPVQDFSEWRGEKGKKERLVIKLPETKVFCIAGLWDENIPDPKLGMTTFTMLTTEANEFMKLLPHHRMPLILSPKDYDRWLDPNVTAEEVTPLLKPSGTPMEYRVAGRNET